MSRLPFDPGLPVSLPDAAPSSGSRFPLAQSHLDQAMVCLARGEYALVILFTRATVEAGLAEVFGVAGAEAETGTPQGRLQYQVRWLVTRECHEMCFGARGLLALASACDQDEVEISQAQAWSAIRAAMRMLDELDVVR